MRFAKPALILAATLGVTLIAAPALAKLPPLSDEAKAKAAETAAKTAWTDKLGTYQLCQSMNRAAEHYRKTGQAGGKALTAPVETPACVEPPPFVAPVPVAAAAASAPPPLEAAGAHSPPKMATSPPSSQSTAAEMQGQPKK